VLDVTEIDINTKNTRLFVLPFLSYLFKIFSLFCSQVCEPRESEEEGRLLAVNSWDNVLRVYDRGKLLRHSFEARYFLLFTSFMDDFFFLFPFRAYAGSAQTSLLIFISVLSCVIISNEKQSQFFFFFFFFYIWVV
jgi:hypothetical protein